MSVNYAVSFRYYEGIKLESEIQNTIMTRYFYYQLVNIYVTIGLGKSASVYHSISMSLLDCVIV